MLANVDRYNELRILGRHGIGLLTLAFAGRTLQDLGRTVNQDRRN
jgi:hypothetical protein